MSMAGRQQEAFFMYFPGMGRYVVYMSLDD